MKYTVFIERKVRTMQYDMLSIGLSMEFDETTPVEAAFLEVRGKVDKWIAEERDRIVGKRKP